jgi:glutathione S-transferase
MLEELAVPYENVPTSFVGDAQKPDYLKLNPNAASPRSTTGILFESLAINPHLAQVRRRKGSGRQRTTSRAVQWSIWAMTESSRPDEAADESHVPAEPQRNERCGAGERSSREARVLEDALAAALPARRLVYGADLNVARGELGADARQAEAHTGTRRRVRALVARPRSRALGRR